VARDQERQQQVLAELARGVWLVSGWPAEPAPIPGWLGVRCPDSDAARWMARAIQAENVAAWQEAVILYLPAGPEFRLDFEILNVITAVAKARHYWTEYAFAQSRHNL
jgi:sirohydrochlorin cobaltochelatase